MENENLPTEVLEAEVIEPRTPPGPKPPNIDFNNVFLALDNIKNGFKLEYEALDYFYVYMKKYVAQVESQCADKPELMAAAADAKKFIAKYEALRPEVEKLVDPNSEKFKKYAEQVGKVADFIFKDYVTHTEYDEWMNGTFNPFKTKTEEDIKQLRIDVDEIKHNWDQLIPGLTTGVDNLKKELDNKIKEVKDSIKNLEDKVKEGQEATNKNLALNLVKTFPKYEKLLWCLGDNGEWRTGDTVCGYGSQLLTNKKNKDKGSIMLVQNAGGNYSSIMHYGESSEFHSFGCVPEENLFRVKAAVSDIWLNRQFTISSKSLSNGYVKNFTYHVRFRPVSDYQVSKPFLKIFGYSEPPADSDFESQSYGARYIYIFIDNSYNMILKSSGKDFNKINYNIGNVNDACRNKRVIDLHITCDNSYIRLYVDYRNIGQSIQNVNDVFNKAYMNSVNFDDDAGYRGKTDFFIFRLWEDCLTDGEISDLKNKDVKPW